MTDIAHLRKTYERAELDETHSASDPLQQFERWLQEALNSNLPEPTAMTLATVGPASIPDPHPAAGHVQLADHPRRHLPQPS